MSPKQADRPIAVISGGGTGMGLATAEKLLAKGYHVTAVGLDREDVLPDGIDFLALDVTDDDAILALAARFPRVDALVNAAGMLVPNSGEYEMKAFRRVMDVNLNGTASLCFAFKDALLASRGAVVNFASMWSIFGSPLTPAYAASKGAVVQLTKSLAVAWGPDGVRVNAVAPGWVDTRISINAKNNEARAQTINERLPLKRWATAEEVSRVVAFLLSEEAVYVTGAIYVVDGGYSVV
jgi:NAD(P)-dependent dehydrogenase (short-subunit alcohol dehydrogenase family)